MINLNCKIKFLKLSEILILEFPQYPWGSKYTELKKFFRGI